MAAPVMLMLAPERKRAGRPAARRLGRPLLYGLSAIAHLPSLFRLWSAPEGSLLSALLAARPEVWSLLRVRFLSANWSPAERFACLRDHCETVEQLGAPFDLRPNERAELLRLDEIGPGYRLVLDSPRWLLLDGLLALSLFEGHERIYSISFILCAKDGPLTAYVGGIQGKRGPDTLERYRDFTKRACGVRPADMAVELLRLLCAELGVARLRCVADAHRHIHGGAAPRRADFDDPVRFDYDTLWRERGGELADDGFFDLPIEPVQKPLAEVPQRKRAERRRRYELMAEIRFHLATAVGASREIAIEQHEPVGWP